MKKILFICSNMNIGGFQKSLINLLKSFDYFNYEVDLFLIDKAGVFLKDIPDEVNILDLKNHKHYFFYNTNESVRYLIKYHNYFLLICRLFISLLSVFDKGYAAILMSKFIPKIKKEYDCCIDYNGQYINYYMIDSVNAKKKITYFHSDYEKWAYYKNADKKYYKKDDAIVTISESCVESLKKFFPEVSDKIYCIENIITSKTVSSKSKIHFKKENDKLCIMTVGRVCIDKGIEYATDAAVLLKKDNVKFKWYWVGPENDDIRYKKMIFDKKIEDVFELLGSTNNPYDYLRAADICVYPSKFEGKSVVIEETKIINKPIVVTNFSTVQNQIENLKSGIIVGMSGNAVYRGIKKLIDDKQLVKNIIEYQKTNCLGNANEIEKLYFLINYEQL